ncbi:hypothetical protein pb186bvf_013522 [Paramecium bursaria]
MQLFIKTSQGKTITIDLEEGHTLQNFIDRIKAKVQTSDKFSIFDMKNNRYLPLDNLQAQIKRDLKIIQETTFEIHDNIQPQNVQQFQPSNVGLQNFPNKGFQGFNPNQNNQFQFLQTPQYTPPQQQIQQQLPTNPFVHIQQPIQNQYGDNQMVQQIIQNQIIDPTNKNSEETQNLQKQLQEKDNYIDQLKQQIAELNQKLQRQQRIIDSQKLFIQERCQD